MCCRIAIPYSRFLIGPITWYSFLVITGIVLALIIGMREEKRKALAHDTMLDLSIVAIPCGVIGSRIYYVIMEWQQYATNPLSVFAIWEGGVAIYGAILGGALGVFIFCRIKHISFAIAVDIIAPGLLLAQAIGRWGNYFNMEAFGPVIEDTRLQFFPFGVQIWENGETVWHMATFFYESLWNACGFLTIMLVRKKLHRDGYVFFLYMLIYGFGRFIIERLRMDSLWFGGIRVSQAVSFLFCMISLAVFLLPHIRKGRS